MKILYLFLVLLFCSVSYSQSDEVKLIKQQKPLHGKVLKIKSSSVEFKQDTTGFLFEFDKDEINYIRSVKGDTLWFNKSEIINENNSWLLDNKGISLFFSYSFPGKHNISSDSISVNQSVYAGISLGAEYEVVRALEKRLKFGLGIMFQFPRLRQNANGDFYFIPIYTFVKFGLIRKEKIQLYLFSSLGYDLFYGIKKYASELEGGFYNALGLGLIIKDNLDVGLSYQFFRGSAKIGNQQIKSEIIYNAFNLNVGYYF